MLSKLISVRGRHGSVLVMTAFGSLFLLAMVALVTDVGWIYYNKSRIQTAVNAGWKAGFDRAMQICSEKNISFAQLAAEPAHAASRAEIQNLVRTIINMNLGPSQQLDSTTTVVTNWNPFEVTGRSSEGLFFARLLNFNTFSVIGQRVGDSRFGGLEIVPLTIPYGVVKDLSKNTYSFEPFSELNQDGFASGTEYILKLGSGNSGRVDSTRRILVPMDDGSQGPAGNTTAVSRSNRTNIGYLKAYGAAYWCLKNGYKPVEWLIGYRGGAFFLPYNPAVITKLHAMNVNYVEVVGLTNVNNILQQCRVIELNNYPIVGVYSSQPDPDAVELVLQYAEIPYVKMYDAEILNGSLDSCNWLHMHHEDFTGWTGGCERLAETCYDRSSTAVGATTLQGTTRNNTNLCAYCRNFYYGFNSNRWSTSPPEWGTASGSNFVKTCSYSTNPTLATLTWVPTSCENYALRCAERTNWKGTRFWSLSNNLLCEDGSERPMCRSAKEAYDLATSLGYTDAPGYNPKRRWLDSNGKLITMNGSVYIPLKTDFIYKPNRVQRMKFDVVKKMMDHVTAGGYMFSQCFAPETIDMTIYQRRVYLDQPSNPSLNMYYQECFAFSGFTYKCFCRKDEGSGMYYSTINSRAYGPFTLLDPLDPRNQNHGIARPNFRMGHCNAFTKSLLKNKVTVLGYIDSNSNAAQYIKGTYGNGEFCFAGGHFHDNIQSQRLVANNILLGALSTKQLEEGEDTEFTGKQKNNYGVVDPDNVTGGGTNDYRDRFMNGFSKPLTIGYRLINEPGNMAGPTDEAVQFRTEFGADATQTRRFVIVPIHDVPPEVGVNNPKNATATTIYDLQGTDHPNGAYKPSEYNFGASIRIIGFAKFEIIPPSEYTRNGGNILSGDAGDLGFYQAGQVRGKFVEWLIKPGEVQIPY